MYMCICIFDFIRICTYIFMYIYVCIKGRKPISSAGYACQQRWYICNS